MNTNVSPRQTIGGLAVAALLAGLLAVGLSNPLPADDPLAPRAADFSSYVSKDGAISLPKDYRETFLHLGSWAVAKKPSDPVFELHNVYAPLKDIQSFRKDGMFPDGATLVKEVTKVGSDKMTTGESSWSTDTKIWFVMVKDSKGRFPDNDLWGDGWGWALFEAKDPARNVATDYTSDCKTCHIPAKQDDWIYVRGYPVLGRPTTAR